MLDNSFINIAILIVLCAILAVLSVMLSMKISKENEEQARIAKVVKKTIKEDFKKCEKNRELNSIKLPHQVETSGGFEYDFHMFKSSIIKQKQQEFHKKYNTLVRQSLLVFNISSPILCNAASGHVAHPSLVKEYFNIENEEYIKENEYVEIYRENERKIKENEDIRKEEVKKILAKYNLMFEEDWNKNKKTYIECYKESKL